MMAWTKVEALKMVQYSRSHDIWHNGNQLEDIQLIILSIKGLNVELSISDMVSINDTA
jgi:hypothetical protein